MNDKDQVVQRVIGLDSHPDSFTAAILQGPTPAAAIVERTFNKLPMTQLQEWAKKNITAQDVIVLEASGNSFHVVRQLARVERKALVLESCHLGKLKEAHANNDKISAIRIGKAYLSGTAKEVWVPDPETQARRDLLHSYRKAIKRRSQMRARIRSYLSDNGIRLEPSVNLLEDKPLQALIRSQQQWSSRQWQVLEGYLADLRHADQQAEYWHSLIAQEVLADPPLLSLVRLCGVREIVAFAVGAFVGDIHRFANPKKLVKYVGLNPAFDDSGENQWHGGIGGHGNNYLRALLIEAAQAILRCSDTPLAKWGKKLLARKGEKNVAVAAMARKLTVAIWYLMMGRWTELEEIDPRLSLKVGKMMSAVGKPGLQKLGKNRKAYREEIYRRLKDGRVYRPKPEKPQPATAQAPGSGRVYVLDLDKKYTPKPKAIAADAMAECGSKT